MECAALDELLRICSTGGEQFEEAQAQVLELENDPLNFLGNLLQLLNEANNDMTKNRAASYICQVVKKSTFESISGKFLTEELAAIVKQELLKYAQMQSPTVMVNKIYDTIYLLIGNYKDDWEGLIEVMASQTETSNAYQAIKSFSIYVDSSDVETLSGEILELMAGIFKRDYDDERAREMQFNLFISLALKYPEFLQENVERAAEILASLTFRFSYASSSFSERLKVFDNDTLELYAPIYATLLASFQKEDVGSVISAIEAFTILIEISEVQDFVLENIDMFVESVIYVLSETSIVDSQVSYTVEAIVELCENAFENNYEIMEIFQEKAEQYFGTDDANLFACLARIYCPPQAFPTLFSLLNESEDINVIENVLNALKKLFGESFKEVTEESEENFVQIFNSIKEKIEAFPEGEGNLPCKVLESLCEGAIESNCGQLVLSVHEGIVEIIGKIFTDDTMLLAATIAAVDTENTFVELSQIVTSSLIELLQSEDEGDFNKGLDLLKYELNFLNKLDEEAKGEFFTAIAGIIEANQGNYRPFDIITQLGFGLCMKSVGKEILAPYIETILGYLIPRLQTRVLVSIESTDADYTNCKHFSLSYANKNLVFHNEEVDQVKSGLKNFSAIIEIFGSDIQQIEGFLENAAKIISVAIQTPYSVEIREIGFEIVCSLIKAFPANATDYMEFIQPYLVPNKEEEQNVMVVVAEPENAGRKAALDNLVSVLNIEGEEEKAALQPFLQAISEIIPPFCANVVTEAQEGVLVKLSNKEDYQECFDCLWSTKRLIYTLEENELSEGKEASIGAYSAVMEILNSVDGLAEFIETIRVGLAADLLDCIPSFGGFEEAFGILQESLQSENPDARGQALYGFGRALSKREGLPAELLDKMLDLLHESINSCESDPEKFHDKRENGISSFCLILKNRMAYGGDYSSHLQHLLELLPVYIDVDESTIVYSFIVDCLNLDLPQEVKDVLFGAIVSCLQDEDASEVTGYIIQRLIENIPEVYRQQLQSE